MTFININIYYNHRLLQYHEPATPPPPPLPPPPPPNPPNPTPGRRISPFYHDYSYSAKFKRGNKYKLPKLVQYHVDVTKQKSTY